MRNARFAPVIGGGNFVATHVERLCSFARHSAKQRGNQAWVELLNRGYDAGEEAILVIVFVRKRERMLSPACEPSREKRAMQWLLRACIPSRFTRVRFGIAPGIE